MAVKRKRAELVAAIRAGFQRVSGQSVVISGVIAEKFGLAPSDLECLGSLQLEGPITAGRLAQLTGLTSGAVTRMIDRLEAGKYVRRRDDPNDRRRVVVELNPVRMKEFAPFYGPMAENSTQLLVRIASEELRGVLRHGAIKRRELLHTHGIQLDDDAPADPGHAGAAG